MIILESDNNKTKTVAKNKKDIKSFCKGCNIYYSIGGLPIYSEGKKQSFYKMIVKNGRDLSINGNNYKLIKLDSTVFIDRI